MNGTSMSSLEADDVIDKDEVLYSIKKRIYLQAKEGFAINLQVLISQVASHEIRNVLVNQVSGTFAIMENFTNHLLFCGKRAFSSTSFSFSAIL